MRGVALRFDCQVQAKSDAGSAKKQNKFCFCERISTRLLRMDISAAISGHQATVQLFESGIDAKSNKG